MLSLRSPAPDYSHHSLEQQIQALKTQLALAKLPESSSNATLAHVVKRDPLDPHRLIISIGSGNGPEWLAAPGPVTIGPHAIGIIERVGKKQSTVRLFSDPSIKVHVKTTSADQLAHHYIGELEKLLPDSSALDLVKRKVKGDVPSSARGFLEGFNGAGNYSGFGLVSLQNKPFRTGEVLVTTGEDGLFPPGLFVARIVEVSPQGAGEVTYRLKAKPTYPLDHLPALHVLEPPLDMGPQS